VFAPSSFSFFHHEARESFMIPTNAFFFFFFFFFYPSISGTSVSLFSEPLSIVHFCGEVRIKSCR